MYWFKNNMYPDSKINIILESLRYDQPTLVGIDTETTGLNQQLDKPFLFIIGYKCRAPSMETKTFCLPKTETFKEDIQTIFDLLYEIKPQYIVGHNIKFDLHMLINLGVNLNKEDIYRFESNGTLFTDTMFLARLVLPTRDEESLGLKSLANTYIEKGSNDLEQQVSAKFMQLTKLCRTLLDAQVKPLGYSTAKINSWLKSDLNFGDSFPKEIMDIYLNWCEIYNVNKFDMKLNGYEKLWEQEKVLVEHYACLDVVLTLELFYQLYDKGLKENLSTEKSLQIFDKENRLIKIYLAQERTGLSVDMNYLQERRQVLIKTYWEYKQELYALLGQPLDEGQHVEIANLLISKFKVDPETFKSTNKNKKTDSPTLDKNTLNKLAKMDGQIKKIATTISFLRKLQKFKSTYLDRIYYNVLSSNDNKFHLSNKQAGTVSGRISGDFQQMPREGLFSPEGEELAHIRKIFKPSGNGYNTLVFNDFDQMELRVQAHYTVEYGMPDSNLIRAFVPYGCVNLYTQNKFDLKQDRDHAKDKDENGESVWVEPYSQKPWSPIDPHGIHVKTTFNIDKDHPKWKHYRTAAKTMNFSCIYGAGLNSMLENPTFEDYSTQEIEAIYNSIISNFPYVKLFRQTVSQIAKQNKQIANMYGRIYLFKKDIYGRENYYKASNYLIQGSCADFVKSLLITIDNYLRQNNAKSRVLCTIHDEVMWELYDGEEYLLNGIRQLMEQESYWSHIPLTVGEDYSQTTWAEKKDISLLKGENYGTTN